MSNKIKILVVVDAQNDFFEDGGVLPIPNSLSIIPAINELLASNEYSEVIFTKDWHPKDHTSFAENHHVEPFTEVEGEMNWPTHCVEGSEGAMIHDGITIPVEDFLSNENDANGYYSPITTVFYKGRDKDIEEYTINKEELEEYCEELLTCLEDDNGNLVEPEDFVIDICGLALDYCVKETALAFKELGFNVRVIMSATEAVTAITCRSALEEMVEKGIKIVESLDNEEEEEITEE